MLNKFFWLSLAVVLPCMLLHVLPGSLERIDRQSLMRSQFNCDSWFNPDILRDNNKAKLLRGFDDKQKFAALVNVAVLRGSHWSGCLGTLIAPHLVLTTARCLGTISGLTPEKVRVKQAGRVGIFFTETWIDAAVTCRREDYDGNTLFANYAIIRLAGYFEHGFSASVMPACLPSRQVTANDGNCFMVGVRQNTTNIFTEVSEFHRVLYSPGCQRGRKPTKTCFMTSDISECLKFIEGSPILCYIDGLWEVHGILSESECKNRVIKENTWFTDTYRLRSYIARFLLAC